MTELAGALPFLEIGATGLVTVIVLMILNDRLVTKPRLDQTIRERDAWRRQAEKWHETAQESTRNESELIAAVREATGTKELHVALSETVARILQSRPAVRDEGEPNG